MEFCVGANTAGVVPAKQTGGQRQRSKLDQPRRRKHGFAAALSKGDVEAVVAALIKALSGHPAGSDCDHESKEDAKTIGVHHGPTGGVGWGEAIEVCGDATFAHVSGDANGRVQ